MLAMRTPVCSIGLCFIRNATGFKVYVGKNTYLSEDSLCAGDADACLYYRSLFYKKCYWL